MARRSITTIVVLLSLALLVRADGLQHPRHPATQNPKRIKIGPIYRTYIGDGGYRQEPPVLRVEHAKSGYQLLPLYATVESPWDEYINKVKNQPPQQKGSIKLLPYNPSQYRQGNQLVIRH